MLEENYMEVIEFVNSKDIRDYWKEIGYEPSALESCWLIWQGKNQTLNKKHLAWKNLIDSSTDCSIPAGVFDMPQKSLHNFLRRYIKIDEEFYNKLESLFDSYFTTLEEQQKKDEETQKQNEELREQINLSSEDFQSQLINEIKVFQDNQYTTQQYLQYQNNLTFFGILMFLLIFVSTLIYKFFKTFI